MQLEQILSKSIPKVVTRITAPPFFLTMSVHCAQQHLILPRVRLVWAEGWGHFISTLRLPLDEAASLRIASGQGVPAPLTALSLACLVPSSRDRFSSLRRSNA